MVREASANGNWRGGVCSVQHVDDILNLPELSQSLIRDKLFSNLKRTRGCWRWTGSKFLSNGRARISVGTRSQLAARVMYVIYYNKPIKDLCVLHACDNVECVNPKHLWLGTNQDNMNDMVVKGRQGNQNGEKNHAHKLTEKEVLEIREWAEVGAKQRDLAKMYGVTFQTINSVVRRKNWKHI